MFFSKKTIDISKPYISRHIKQLIPEKKNLLKLYDRYPITCCSAYKACRNKLNIEVRKAKRAYFRYNLKRNEHNPKQMWWYINQNIGRTQVKRKKIYDLNGQNGIIHNSSDIVNVLNDFFSLVGLFSKIIKCQLIEMLTETFYRIPTVKPVVSNSQLSLQI